MSASALPIVPVLLYDRLMPLVGTPMLSRIPASSFAGYLAPDVAIDLIHVTSCFLNARPGLGPNMKQKLSRIDGGKKVLAQPRYQQKTRQAEEQEATHEDFALLKALVKQSGVFRPQ